jgi:pilus assembly protein CpaC
MATKPFSAAAALAIAGVPLALAATAQPAAAQTVSAPEGVIQLGTGRGRLVTVREPISDVFVAADGIADVTVRSPTQFWVFGKTAGETTVYAVTKAGKVAYSSNLRVGDNIDTMGSMLRAAMPDAAITATPMNGLVLLTGTVANPSDVAEAERLTQAFVGEKTKVVSRLRTATPLQVNLQVKIAEVSRSFLKNIGTNFQTYDATGGFKFGIGQGRAAQQYAPNGGLFIGGNQLPTGNNSGLATAAPGTTLAGAGRLLGLDILGSLDLGETIGQVTTLANPNLTALSGETATFLAGGEIPIPIAQGFGAVTVQYKQYGVSLAYTPTVLADGRISLRVRPEVSELSSAGSVTFQGTQIPALTTRRAETTIELGSGQSFMIGGLLQNTHNNQIEKAPGLGDVPILGALFRSNGFRRQETELVIVVTPYLVNPVDANSIALPTDGYKSPGDAERVLLGQLEGTGGGPGRPKPSMAPAPAAPPSIGAAAPAPTVRAPEKAPKSEKRGAAAPGFSQ